MAETKDTAVANTTPLSKMPDTSISIASDEAGNRDAGITLAQRGVTSDDEETGDSPFCIRGESVVATHRLADHDHLLGKLNLGNLHLVLFLLKNIDADNISNARIMIKGTDRNIMTELNMTSDQYNLSNVLYYVPYIVFKAPSNLLLKKFRPSVWQSRIMISWGIALFAHVGVSNKGGIYATRFLLGLFEAGVFPAVISQLTYWHRPDELSMRLLYFYVLGNLSGVFSGLLAYDFDTVSGSLGLSGWQYLFLFEGLVTVVFGVAVVFLLPDFPDTAKFLNEREKTFIQARLPPNAPRASEDNFNLSEIVDALKDKRLWLFTLIWATFTVGTSGVRFYQPTVIANLGYTSITQAQLLNLPISILAIVVISVTGFFADNARIPRPVYALSIFAIIIACYAVLVVYSSNGAVYTAMLIGIACTAAFFPLMWPWRVQTTSCATGSAFSIGFVNSYGQIGGAIGPQIFKSKYAPRYRESFASAMGLVGACTITTLVTWCITRQSEADTRKLKRARMQAEKDNLAVLDDVVDRDLQRTSAKAAP